MRGTEPRRETDIDRDRETEITRDRDAETETDRQTKGPNQHDDSSTFSSKHEQNGMS